MISREIRRLRKHLKLTQVKFGELIGVGASTVQKWEGNTRTPNLRSLIKINEYLDEIKGEK